MSEFLESGLHPDADQINAFVEQALPSHERGEMLAHLADCARCRSIVALSLPPAEESESLRAKATPRRWFAGWRLTWPVAAACSAVTLLALYFHHVTTSAPDARPAELAESRGSAPLLPRVPPQPTVLQAVPPAPTARPTSPRARASADLAKQAAPGEDRDAKTANVAPANSNLPAGSAGQAMGGTLTGREVRSAVKPGAAAGVAGAAQYGLAPPPPPQAAPGRGSYSELNQTAAVVNLAQAPIEPVTRNELSLMALKLAPLPSGRPILSSASSGSMMVALDSSNSLFFSNDEGRTWKAVSRQWNGRALKVNQVGSAGTDFHGSAPGAELVTGKGIALVAGSASASSTATATDGVSGASVSGTLTDISGAAIRGGVVVLSDATKQNVRSTTTDSAGRYVMDGVSPGNYELRAQAPGFQGFDQPITVTASQRNVKDLKLQVGAATQTVEVDTSRSAVALSEPAAKQATRPAGRAQQPTAVFEITTDAGERWTSADGLTWSRSPAP